MSNEQIYSILVFFGILTATVILAVTFNKIFGRFIRNSSTIIQNDPTNYKFLRHAITGLIYIVGFSWALFTLPTFKTIASSLLTGAGILAVVVGLASQHALSNIMSGIFIIIFKPFRVNDRLRLKDNTLAGIVEDITLRHTIIRDFEHRRIIIPNSIISNEIIVNSDYGDDRICKWVEVGISYNSNIGKARQIIKEEIKKHPLYIDARTKSEIEEGVEEIPVRVISLGDFSILMRGYAWTKDTADAFQLGCDLLEVLKKRFDEEADIEIPYPYQNIVLTRQTTKHHETKKA